MGFLLLLFFFSCHLFVLGAVIHADGVMFPSGKLFVCLFFVHVCMNTEEGLS